MFAVRIGLQVKTLSPQLADLRTCRQICESAQHCLTQKAMTMNDISKEALNKF